jgi:uncharacterized membrane protein YozB (DUF420 family)
MVHGFESRVEAWAAPNLRWRWLATAIITALVAVVLMVTMVLPPYGDTALKAVFIMIFGLIAIACTLFTFFSLIEGDDHPELT